MSNEKHNDTNLVQLNDSDLDAVTGGISDHSVNCNHTISGRCAFCVHQKHGQLVIQGQLHDIIGCMKSPTPTGSIGGYVLAILAAGPTPVME